VTRPLRSLRVRKDGSAHFSLIFILISYRQAALLPYEVDLFTDSVMRRVRVVKGWIFPFLCDNYHPHCAPSRAHSRASFLLEETLFPSRSVVLVRGGTRKQSLLPPLKAKDFVRRTKDGTSRLTGFLCVFVLKYPFFLETLSITWLFFLPCPSPQLGRKVFFPLYLSISVSTTF